MIKELNAKIYDYCDDVIIFGIILFTNKNPHIIKVLKDVEYWNALNELSGEQIAIFISTLFDDKAVQKEMDFFVNIHSEPIHNYDVLSWFDISDPSKLPMLVLFGFDEKKTYQVGYPLISDTKERTYEMLESVLNLIGSYVAKIDKSAVNKKKLFKKLGFKITMIKAKDLLKRLANLAALGRSASGI